MRSEGNAPKNGELAVCFWLHDNSPAHRSVFVKDFLAKSSVTTLEHPLFSPDLVAADFFPVA